MMGHGSKNHKKIFQLHCYDKKSTKLPFYFTNHMLTTLKIWNSHSMHWSIRVFKQFWDKNLTLPIDITLFFVTYLSFAKSILESLLVSGSF